MTMLPPDPLYVMTNRMAPVMCTAVSSKRDVIYCGTQAGAVHIWSLETKRQVDRFDNGSESCISLHILTNDSAVIFDKSGILRLWQKLRETWTCSTLMKVDYLGFCQCRTFDSLIFVPTSHSKVKILSLPALEVLKECAFSEENGVGEVMSMVPFDYQGQRCILIAAENSTISIWDWNSNKRQGSPLQLADCPMAMDFDSVKMRGIVGTPSMIVSVFNVASDFSMKIWREVKLINEGVSSVTIRPDRKLVALGCWDGKIRLLSWKTLVTLAALDIHSETIHAVSFTSEEPYIMIAGCKSGKMSVWDIYNGKR